MPVSASSARTAARTLSVDEALERILARVRELPIERLALLDTLGATLAVDIVADRDVPPFRNSAMDGYAVRGADVTTAPVTLRVAGDIAAGATPTGAVRAGEAMRIMTGAPMPDGADTVVRVEDTDNRADRVTVTVPTKPGTSVRAAGEDLKRGETILRRGTVLRAAEVGVLATLGHTVVTVVRRPTVAVLSTGDELAELDEDLGPGQIRDANRYSLASAVRTVGASPLPIGIVRDTAADLRRALRAAAEQADVIVTSGGVSVGDHDHVKPVVDELGSMDFWSIAIRPGRPLAFGEIAGKPIFGLPGNPVSALLGFELFVRPALLKMAGRTLLHRPRVTATLDDTLDTPPGLRFFARGIYDPLTATVRTTGPQGSGILRSMALANSFIEVPETVQHLDRGAAVTVIRTDLPEDH
ncbi:MAG: molybdopterin molybdotransferase [Chloroflexota bacterium]|jgi:molybdopterin molybdotransferase|nr:molybdopterin molybdotransferase [Chloroflexota bacterium]